MNPATLFAFDPWASAMHKTGKKHNIAVLPNSFFFVIKAGMELSTLRAWIFCVFIGNYIDMNRSRLFIKLRFFYVPGGFQSNRLCEHHLKILKGFQFFSPLLHSTIFTVKRKEPSIFYGIIKIILRSH
jgi:hypothetical protein